MKKNLLLLGYFLLSINTVYALEPSVPPWVLNVTPDEVKNNTEPDNQVNLLLQSLKTKLTVLTDSLITIGDRLTKILDKENQNSEETRLLKAQLENSKNTLDEIKNKITKLDKESENLQNLIMEIKDDLTSVKMSFQLIITTIKNLNK